MRKALGKGIGALIPGAPPRRTAVEASPPEEPPHGRVQELPLDSITLNPRQPRIRFDDETIAELASSMRDRGILQPVLVRTVGAERFELIAGERRLRAAKLAGLAQIPALVREANDGESLVLALIENVQRADLTALEEARAYQALMEEFSLTQDEVAHRVGKSRPTIADTLRLLQLPEEAQRELEAGKITPGHARALLAMQGSTARTALTREIVARGLSVREAEKAATRARRAGGRTAGGPGTSGDPDLKRMESDLSRALGTKVVVRTGREETGTIEVAFFSHDDLARLVSQLTGRRGIARSAGN